MTAPRWTQNYFDPLVQDATRLYLITRHFPEKVASIPPQALENMVKALKEERYTTYLRNEHYGAGKLLDRWRRNPMRMPWASCR